MRTSTTEKVAGRQHRETLGKIRSIEFATTKTMASALAAAKSQAIAQAEALGADCIMKLQLEITELSNGLFSATASGLAVRTIARTTGMTSLIAEFDFDDEMVQPFMWRATKTGRENFVH